MGSTVILEDKLASEEKRSVHLCGQPPEVERGLGSWLTNRCIMYAALSAVELMSSTSDEGNCQKATVIGMHSILESDRVDCPLL